MSIIFIKLNILNFCFSLILKLLFIKVYYLSISESLRSKKLIKFLEKIEIKYLNYYTHKKKIFPNSFLKATDSSFSLAKKTTSNLKKKGFFSKNFKDEYFETYLQVNFRNSSNNYYEYFETVNYSVSDKYCFFFLPRNLITSQCLKKYKNFYNLGFFLDTINNFYFYISLFSKLLHSKIFNLIKKQITKNKNTKFQNKKECKYIYFTQFGINENNNILDFFFKKNKLNPFKIEKAIFIDLKPRSEITKESLEYYRDNNIRTFFLNELSYNLDKKNFLKIITKVIKLIFKNDLYLSILYFKFFFEVEINKSRLRKFNKIKLAFVSYEYLFPISLSVACKYYNIKLVGIQRRMHLLMYAPNLILDYYFMFGKKTALSLKKRQISKIKIIPFNLKDLFFRNFPKIKKKDNLNCIVFDVSSKLNWYDDSQLKGSNWKINRDFYFLIIEIAERFKNINFFIKSKKKQSWLNLPYFKKIKINFSKSNNIKLLNQNDKLNSEDMIDQFDFAIGKHTSAIDHFLVCDKISIIYEDPINISSIANYGKDIFSFNKDDLINKLEKLVVDYKEYNNSLNNSKNKIYFCNKEDNFFKSLKYIYKESFNKCD